MKSILALCIFLILFSCQNKIDHESHNLMKPVFQLDYANPTKDKPQSKLWYSDGSYWAILPKSDGPSLWQRDDHGWIEHENVNKTLSGIPGRADVWAEDGEITAVGVDKDSLVVFRLIRDSGIKWKAKILQTLYPPALGDEIETATIALDDSGIYWVASDAGNKVCVWSSEDSGLQWSEPIIIEEKMTKDDICAITKIPNGIGVIWSDQEEEALYFKSHRDGQPVSEWDSTITVQQGNNNADDHINTVLAADGTLWVATKSSVDSVGQPLFVLRVRRPNGQWYNFPYANLEKDNHPSRPIISAVEGDSPMILSGHTIYSHGYSGSIEFGMVDTHSSQILREIATVITPDTSDWVGKNIINDVTGAKRPYGQNQPWIVLASDGQGRVYEADLSRFFR